MKYILIIFLFMARPALATEISFTFKWPNDWTEFDVSYSTVPPGMVKQCTNVVYEFLNAYPEEELSRRLKKITVVGSLSVDGSSYYGTNHWAREEIYVVCQRDSTRMLRALHHEFSSILLWNNKDYFDFSEWIAQNPKGLDSYVLGWHGNGSDAAKQNLNGDWLSPSLFRKGFLTDYNQVSFENDFNRFAEYIFVHPDKVLALKKHSRIMAKTKLLIDFYYWLGIRISLR